MKQSLIMFSFYATFSLFAVCFFGGLGGMVYDLVSHDRSKAYFFQIFAVGSIFVGRVSLVLRDEESK